MGLNVVCLDMEGVLVPEIWIAFSKESGIPELSRTTRDEPDYDKLMQWRIGVLKDHGLKLTDVQNTIAKIDPLPGAKEFLDELRSITQVIVLSDTFSQFAQPLMKKLDWPTLFCNELIIDEEGYIADIKMRCEHSKLTTVRGLQSIGFETIAAGDSYVCVEDERVIGTFYYVFGADVEPTYALIEEGAWRDPSPYGVVHRIATDHTVYGTGMFCVNWAYLQCGHLRIDTHGDNTVMQGMLAKLGFVHCGTIYVHEDHDPRLAYEKSEKIGGENAKVEK